MREQDAVTAALLKGGDIERHIVNEIGVRVGEPVFVPGEDKVMEVAAKLIDEPRMFAGNAPRCAGRRRQEDDMTQSAELAEQVLEPWVRHESCPELARIQVLMGKKLKGRFLHEWLREQRARMFLVPA